MSGDVDGVLAAIDSAVEDHAVSVDAMRSAPDGIRSEVPSRPGEMWWLPAGGRWVRVEWVETVAVGAGEVRELWLDDLTSADLPVYEPGPRGPRVQRLRRLP